MNLKALRYISLGIKIPDFLFVITHDDFKKGSNYHKAFCTVCKKATENWKFVDDEYSSFYEKYVHIYCHEMKHRIPIVEGDLLRHKEIFEDVYQNENNHSLQ